MVSLVDIVDIRKTVTLRGKEIEIEGINAEKIGMLILTYPELRAPFAGKAMELSPDDIMKMAPKVVASVIAAGTGAAGDAKAEEAAGKLSLGEQATLVHAIYEVTFPDGIGPFVERLRSMGLFDAAAVGESGWGAGMNSQKPPSPLQAEAPPTSRPS